MASTSSMVLASTSAPVSAAAAATAAIAAAAASWGWSPPRRVPLGPYVWPSLLPGALAADGDGRLAVAHGGQVQVTRRTSRRRGRNDYRLSLGGSGVARRVTCLHYWRGARGGSGAGAGGGAVDADDEGGGGGGAAPASADGGGRPLLVVATEPSSDGSIPAAIGVYDTRAGRGMRLCVARLPAVTGAVGGALGRSSAPGRSRDVGSVGAAMGVGATAAGGPPPWGNPHPTVTALTTAVPLAATTEATALFAGTSTGHVIAYGLVPAGRRGTPAALTPTTTLCVPSGAAVVAVAGDGGACSGGGGGGGDGEGGGGSPLLAAADDAGEVVVWGEVPPAAGGGWKVLFRNPPPEDEERVTSLALRGGIAAAGYASGRLVLWDVARGVRVVEAVTNDAAVSVVTWWPGGDALLVAGEDGRATVLAVTVRRAGENGGDSRDGGSGAPSASPRVLLSVCLDAVVTGGAFACRRPGGMDVVLALWDRPGGDCLVRFDHLG